MTDQPRFNTLNAKQIHLLKLIYKFRYITAPLLAKYKNLNSRQAMHTTLERLVKQNYLGKRVDTNETFNNKGARYYLAPAALKLLRDHGLGERALRAMGKNDKLSEGFVDQNIAAVRAYLALQTSYPDLFHQYTQSEVADSDHFPTPRPQIYLKRVELTDDLANNFMLYNFSQKPTFEIKKEFAKLVEHFDSGDWEKEEEIEYPKILIVCSDSRVEWGLHTYIAKTLENAGIDELGVYLTTNKALMNSGEETRAIWSSVTEPKKTVSLDEIMQS